MPGTEDFSCVVVNLDNGSVAFRQIHPKETTMKAYVQRILTGFITSDVLTHALPYQARVESRSARDS